MSRSSELCAEAGGRNRRDELWDGRLGRVRDVELLGVGCGSTCLLAEAGGGLSMQ